MNNAPKTGEPEDDKVKNSSTSETAKKGPPKPKPYNSNRILLVDDEDGIRAVFSKLLRVSLPRHTIDVAKDGAEGLRSFKKEHHALIIMDIFMPIMDGNKAFAKISAWCREKKWQMPFVVFCTGYDPPSAISKLVQNDPRHCIVHKPVGSQSLVEVIKKKLGLEQSSPQTTDEHA